LAVLALTLGTSVSSVSFAADAPAAPATAPATAHDTVQGQPALVIHRGERLSGALEHFGQSFPHGQRWTVLWYCQDWGAPGKTVFKGDFVKVSKEFIRAIASDGADIHGKWWLGNRVLVVTGSGAMQ
jgi:hypothetical protein